MDMYRVIKRPLITEKSVQDAKLGKFTFLIAHNAGKNAVKKAIETTFKVNVVDIATNIQKGRKKRTGPKRIEIEMSVVKKAIVKLLAGQKIDLFDIKSE